MSGKSQILRVYRSEVKNFPAGFCVLIHFPSLKNLFVNSHRSSQMTTVDTDDSCFERSPLLAAQRRTARRAVSRQVSEDNPNRNRYTSFTDTQTRPISECVVIERHLNLFHSIGIMVGSVCGTGIFVSPTGVTRAVRSVGLTLIIWAVCGLFNLLLALCYAELGTAMPVAGGDYSYINHLLGPFPAFLCLWTICVLIAPCAVALMARTIGAYFTTLFDQDCNTVTVVIIAIWVTGVCRSVPCFSNLKREFAWLVDILDLGEILVAFLTDTKTNQNQVNTGAGGLKLKCVIDMIDSSKQIYYVSFPLPVAAAMMNVVSVKWSARVVTLTSLGKLVAMGVIIVAGIVKFAEGATLRQRKASSQTSDNFAVRKPKAQLCLMFEQNNSTLGLLYVSEFQTLTWWFQPVTMSTPTSTVLAKICWNRASGFALQATRSSSTTCGRAARRTQPRSSSRCCPDSSPTLDGQLRGENGENDHCPEAVISWPNGTKQMLLRKRHIFFRESLTALSEEMINPERYEITNFWFLWVLSVSLHGLSSLRVFTKFTPWRRDLPLAAGISMLVVIGVYLLINIAYFTVLTPIEFIASDAVALVSSQCSRYSFLKKKLLQYTRAFNGCDRLLFPQRQFHNLLWFTQLDDPTSEVNSPQMNLFCFFKEFWKIRPSIARVVDSSICNVFVCRLSFGMFSGLPQVHIYF